MSNNSRNLSNPDNNTSASTPPTSGLTNSNNFSHDSVSDFILLPILSLTIILAVAYTILVLARPTFRANKLNWFTINVCLTSAFLSIIMLEMSIMDVMHISSSLSCRVQSFLPTTGASQMMYSHAVIAVSRLLTIVYSTKRIFRSIACIYSFIAFGWIIAFLVAVPYLLVDGFMCGSSSRATFSSYYTLSSILIIPVMIVLICSIRIFLSVRRSSQRVHAEGRRNNVSHGRDVRLIKTMIVTFTVFIAGWAPLFLMQAFSEGFNISSTVSTVFQILPPLSMFFDVILLIYTNQPIRLFLRQLIVRQRQIIPNITLANTVNRKAHIIHNP